MIEKYEQFSLKETIIVINYIFENLKLKAIFIYFIFTEVVAITI